MEGVKRSGGVKKCGCLKNFFIVNMTDFHGVVGFTAFFLEKKFEKYLEDVIFIYIFAAKRYDKKRSLK